MKNKMALLLGKKMSLIQHVQSREDTSSNLE